MQGARHVSEHLTVNLSRFGPRGDLECRDQLGGVGISSVGSVSEPLEQRLQQEKIAKGKLRSLASGRHVAGGAVEGDEDFVRRFLEESIEIGRERRRPALGDRGSDLLRMLVDGRWFRAGFAHAAGLRKDGTVGVFPGAQKVDEIHREFRHPGALREDIHGTSAEAASGHEGIGRTGYSSKRGHAGNGRSSFPDKASACSRRAPGQSPLRMRRSTTSRRISPTLRTRRPGLVLVAT